MSLRNLFGPLMLHRKLVLAFLAMALVTALSGAVGLYFVSNIGGAFSVFSEVTEPLSRHSTQLSENAEQIAKVVVRAVSDNRPVEDVANKLESLQAVSLAHLAEMRGLIAATGINVDLDSAGERLAEFVATLGEILRNDQRARAAAASGAELQTEFDAKRRATYAAVHAIVDRVDGVASEIEEAAKVQHQTGAATVDSLAQLMSSLLTEIYPVQRYASKLLTELARIDDLSRRLARLDTTELSQASDEARASLDRIDNILGRLGGRLQDPNERTEFLQVKADFDALAASLQGLFAGQREVLAARAQTDAGRARLEQIDRTYIGILTQMGAQLESRNQAARLQARSAAASATNVVTLGAVLAFIAALSFAFFFARRISAPLISLAGHATAMRESGELRPLPDAAVNARHDEVGMLARSFNALVVELAEAKARLIEWSEGEIKAQFERLNAAVNNMPVGLCMFDSDQKLIICNSRYAGIYKLDPRLTKPGTPLRDILTHRVENRIYAEGKAAAIDERLQAVAVNKPWYQVNELRDGTIIAVSHHPLADGGSIATHEDITERRKAEQRIAYLAHYDALTDLPNRVSFREKIVETLEDVDESSPIAVLCVDLDNFKSVNDTLGHPVGDALLKAVSGRLLNCIRGGDTVARLGGDEFAIVQIGCEQPVAATALADRLIRELSEPYIVEGHQVVIGASVGISVSPVDGADSDQLLKKADMALYRAKQSGRGRYSFFEPDMDAEMQRRRELELALRKAVVLEEFEVYYQPIISVRSGDITGFEALLRWHHPDRGMMMPLEFVPLAEEIGLINQIGAWVLKQACRAAVDWPDHINIAVNISPMQFRGDTLVLDVIAALGASGLPARRLEIEITETVLLHDTDATIAILNQLRDLGVHIAMDDFGTGYSSLGYLQKFPFDKIKIDRSFVHDLADKPDSRAIIRAVAGIGSTLGIVTTAEGVETAGELSELTREGCTEVQGYLFSKPRPLGEVAGIIDTFKAKCKSVA